MNRSALKSVNVGYISSQRAIYSPPRDVTTHSPLP